jgi:hypothetical protein
MGFLGEQDVVQNASKLVCSCGDGLRGSELGAPTAEELSEVALRHRGLAPSRSVRAARLFTLRVLQDKTLPPLTRFFGQKPSHDAKADGLRNRRRSGPTWVRITRAVTA